MFKTFAVAAFGAALFGAVFANIGEASEAGLPNSSFAAVGAATSVPYGWVDFCGRRQEECGLGKLKPLDVRMTKASWSQLNRVNRSVNAAIEPMTNLAHWGTTLDHWDYPVDGKGDCKVYALYKRKLLIDAGFPRQALLMTVVRDLEGEGHAILTVKTDRGEFVLDNLTDDIRPWDATGYTYLKRQAQDDPNVWLDLGGVRGAPRIASAPTDGG
jgi:predicted transglutaminase-like cysteine proteinase